MEKIKHFIKNDSDLIWLTGFVCLVLLIVAIAWAYKSSSDGDRYARCDRIARLSKSTDIRKEKSGECWIVVEGKMERVQ